MNAGKIVLASLVAAGLACAASGFAGRIARRRRLGAADLLDPSDGEPRSLHVTHDDSPIRTTPGHASAAELRGESKGARREACAPE